MKSKYDASRKEKRMSELIQKYIKSCNDKLPNQLASAKLLHDIKLLA